jgi:DNA replication and repair protein RecF
LLGPNGQGKTNLVEAVGYLATMASHRTGSDAPLVRAGAERAIVRAQVVRDDRQVLLEVEIAAGRANRGRINRGKPTRARDLLGWLRAVLFAPEDLALVKGDPDGRRRFMDELLTLRWPRFAGVRSDYERVVKQRSALLRSSGAARSARENALATLAIWDDQLVKLGSELAAARIRLAHELAPLVAATYDEIAPGRGDPSLSYRAGWIDAGWTAPAKDESDENNGSPVPGEVEEFMSEVARAAPVDGQAEVAARMNAALLRVREREFDRGVCLVGPHRDDLVVALSGMPARAFASQGESWSLALGLRLASHDLLSADGDQPVLLLDDVFAELDTARRAALARRVERTEQVLITAAVEDDVPMDVRGVRYQVSLGQVSRA